MALSWLCSCLKIPSVDIGNGGAVQRPLGLARCDTAASEITSLTPFCQDKFKLQALKTKEVKTLEKHIKDKLCLGS